MALIKNRHPAEYLIKALMVRNRHESGDAKWVNDKLQENGIPPADSEYLETLHDSLISGLPDGFDPQKPQDDEDFLRAEGIFDLLVDSDEMAPAWEILWTPSLRSTLEYLLLGFPDEETISALMKEKTGREIPIVSIKMYRHCFFNTTIVGGTGWKSFLGDDEEGKEKLAVAKKGPHVALYGLGLHKREDWSWIRSRMQASLFALFEVVDANFPVGEQKIRMMSELCRNITMLQKESKDVALAMEEFMAKMYKKLEMVTDNSRTQTSDELPGILVGGTARGQISIPGGSHEKN